MDINNYNFIGNQSQENIFNYYNNLNNDTFHMNTNDDICTPMKCVKTMIDYLPDELWERNNLKILDPCCGNGNFGAYCLFKTSNDNIYYNEMNILRYNICKQLLNPKHISNADFFNFFNNEDKFDLIMANPPYSGGGNKNKSISNKFIEKSIDLLKDNGYLCFITPNNWMTYNNNNTTLHKLLNEGSFIVIDNDVKKFFPKVGSSFTIFIWQKSVKTNKTLIINNYLIKDVQKDIVIPSTLNFIPLYISQTIINIVDKLISSNRNKFNYRCDLHNFTQKKYLSDIKDDIFKYKTIHTVKKTRFASKKQDIYDKWLIIFPLSTYYKPFIINNVNVTQSVGYMDFNNKEEAENYLKIITLPHFKLLIHLTRYGNFNNIMVLKHLNFDENIGFSMKEKAEINNLIKYINY